MLFPSSPLKTSSTLDAEHVRLPADRLTIGTTVRPIKRGHDLARYCHRLGMRLYGPKSRLSGLGLRWLDFRAQDFWLAKLPASGFPTDLAPSHPTQFLGSV